ncbi:MAG: translation initiation factor IF-2 [Candidatus Amulumruptor caecigallinarius]|nr:translation initiation factor IF-2 [Candidatus Amulumruptor caecigallinarius]
MRTKISKVAKDLNVGVNTAVEFLRKNNIEVDEGNPNARIDSSAVELLMKEFSKDKNDKAVAERYINSRKEDKKEKPSRNEREALTSRPVGPRILGKIDLDNPNAGMKSASSAEPETKTIEAKVAQDALEAEPVAQKAEPAAQMVEPAAQKAEPAAQKKVPDEPKNELVKPKIDTPSPKAEKAEEAEEVRKADKVEKAKEAIKAEEAGKAEKANKADEHAEHAAATQSDTPSQSAPFRLGGAPQGPELKVLGKIDLSAINQSTRPRKKSKADRKAENADRKKRKRIGKEKVDIEKAAQQPGFGSENRKKQGSEQGGRRQGGSQDSQQGSQGRGDRGGKKRDRRAVKQEVSSEDVQKQVKETLARLTNKSVKKSVKFRKEKRVEMHKREDEQARREAEESKVLKITEFVTANDLASLMNVPVNNVIATCMNIGVMVSINQRLDAETINLVAGEFGFDTEFVSADVTEAIESVEDKEEDLESRPPIVTVMGHVDHGKTSLLDYIRKANVIAGEAGGITQHIGAYNVTLPNGRHITFLDTPGHEAFTAMRARGAKVTDLAIIIVAADDDVMPQTIEAINHASAAGVPMVFAINKIDKPAANPDKIKEELAGMNYLVEDWGGKYQSQDISAKKGTGVEELMEKVLLEAEMLELKANPNRNAIGSVIESSLDKGRGYVATVLVQNGTLRVGDVILAGTNYGKVKAMFNERNQRVKEAGPATPVLILGLNGAPQAGDSFNVMDSEQEAREIASKREQLQRELSIRTKKRPGLEELGRRRALNDFHELNLVVKGDVDGSVEALSDSLLKLSTPEIQVNVLHKGVGAISESDVTLAAASDAIIIGFQVRPSGAARKEAEKEGVEIRLYSVIYKAIEEVKDAMEGLLSPEIKEEITGNAEVLQTYKISKVGTIAGAIVRDGKIKRTSRVRVIRDGIVIYTGELGSLKRFKDDVKEVVSGYDCGLSVQGYNDIREGDIIEAYEEVEVKKTL